MPTLYLNGYNTEARLSNRGIQVIKKSVTGNKTQRMMVPLYDLDQVVIAGRPYVTLSVIQRLAGEGIPVMFVSSRGRWLGGLYPNKNGHALRRIRQYQLAHDSDLALEISRALIMAKIWNSRRVLQRLSANRDESRLREQTDVSDSLSQLAFKVKNGTNKEQIVGYEGVASAMYFRRLGDFFPEDIPYRGRSRRPPRDAANALMSWTYTILLGEIDTAVRSAGLDPCIGFIHEIAYGRPSLSLDLLEPFRAPVCDLLTLQILNHRILKIDDFEIRDADGGTYLKKEARKAFFVEYERAVDRHFSAEKGGAHTSFRRLIRDAVQNVLKAMERKHDYRFFKMP